MTRPKILGLKKRNGQCEWCKKEMTYIASDFENPQWIDECPHCGRISVYRDGDSLKKELALLQEGRKMVEISLKAIRRFENRLSVAYSRYKKGKIWRVRCICGEWMDIWGNPEEMVIAVCTDPHHVMNWHGYRGRFCKILSPLK